MSLKSELWWQAARWLSWWDGLGNALHMAPPLTILLAPSHSACSTSWLRERARQQETASDNSANYRTIFRHQRQKFLFRFVSAL